jgi:hypothetical protein
MTDEKKLLKIDNPKSIAEFLQQPASKIAELLTGILVSDSKDLKLSVGKLVQASLQSKLFLQLGKEIEGYMDKGKIKKDYLSSQQNLSSLSELLRFIDEEAPDKVRFKVIKTLFFISVFHDIDGRNKALAYQFMQIAKRLSSGDFSVLKAAFEIATEKAEPHVTGINLAERSVGSWLKCISEQIGHGIRSMVELHEQNLMDLKLISRRTGSDSAAFVKTPYYRLTDLGYKFCIFLTEDVD